MQARSGASVKAVQSRRVGVDARFEGAERNRTWTSSTVSWGSVAADSWRVRKYWASSCAACCHDSDGGLERMNSPCSAAWVRSMRAAEAGRGREGGRGLEGPSTHCRRRSSSAWSHAYL